MIVGSTKEDLNLEKRVSITPETAKNIAGLGLSICLEKKYAVHLGIQDKLYEDVGVKFYESSDEVMSNSDLLTKVNCPSEKEIKNLTQLIAEPRQTKEFKSKNFVYEGSKPPKNIPQSVIDRLR